MFRIGTSDRRQPRAEVMLKMDAGSTSHLPLGSGVTPRLFSEVGKRIGQLKVMDFAASRQAGVTEEQADFAEITGITLMPDLRGESETGDGRVRE
jgi:hypothetical protein